MNREVGTSGMGVKSATLPFELKTVGSHGYKDTDYLPSGTDGYELLDEALASGTLTTSTSGKIEWLVTSDYQAKNYAGDKKDDEIGEAEDRGELGIRPGSSGVLKFWIVPRNDSVTSLDLTFQLDVTAFKKVYQTDGSGSILYDESGNAVELTPTALTASDQTLKDYVDCHILFFKYHGDEPVEEGQTPSTKYSGLIDDSFEETVEFEDADSDGHLDPAEIKIHWVWPETFGEAVLTDDDLSDGRTSICETTTVTEEGTTVITNELLTKFNLNPGGFLNGYSFPSGTTALTQAQIKSSYSSMSIQYNNADQEIGDNISYLLAEMTVDLDTSAN